jgi:hypothetical protein
MASRVISKKHVALATGLALADGRNAFALDRFRVLRSVSMAYFSEEDRKLE